MDYADDIALLDETDDAARGHLLNLQVHTAEVGLRTNMDKIKIMAWPGLAQNIVLSNGTAIQQVDEFKYLGSMMSFSA